MQLLKNVLIYCSVLLFTHVYAQTDRENYTIKGYLDFDNVIDTLSYQVSGQLLKGKIITANSNLNFKIENDLDNPSSISIPSKGNIAIISSGTGMSAVERIQIYIYDPKTINWIYSKSLTIYHNVDNGTNIPSIEFSYTSQDTETIDGKEVKYIYTKPDVGEINLLIDDVRKNKIPTYQIVEYIFNHPINSSNVEQYNNLAYFLKGDDLSLYILENVIKKFPNRTVAYLNLGDSYYELGNEKQARYNYKKYLQLMKMKKKNLKKIPKYVYERIK